MTLNLIIGVKVYTLINSHFHNLISLLKHIFLQFYSRMKLEIYLEVIYQIMIISYYLFILTSPILSYSQYNSNAILGKWMTIESNLEVEVYKQNDEFKAKIIWFDDTDDKSKPMTERMDEKNPNPALRSRKWLGLDVLHNLRYYPDDNEWEDGKIYNCKTGKEYSS